MLKISMQCISILIQVTRNVLGMQHLIFIFLNGLITLKNSEVLSNLDTIFLVNHLARQMVVKLPY